MSIWGKILDRGAGETVRKEDAELYMNEVEKALYRRGKALPHKGQFFINNVGTLIEILGSTEKLTTTKNNESLLLTIKYAVWNDEITENRIEYVNVEADIDDFYWNYREYVKNRFEEDLEEYKEDIIEEYSKEWNKCYLPILKEFLKTKTWTDKCDAILDKLWHSGALNEELDTYKDEYLMCKYFDYNEVDWSDKECYWDEKFNCWVGCNADIIFEDITWD